MDRTHVLIVEDDASVSELLFSCLAGSGYRVSVAQSGESALQQIEEDPPEVIVLDLNLPGMNGLDVCRAMRQDPWMSKLPVLMLTGKTEEDDIVAGLEVGADDYMTKPFSPKLLTARVKALLRRGSNPQGTAFATGDPPVTEGATQTLIVKTLGKCELLFADRRLSWDEEFSPAQRQFMAMLVGEPAGKVSQEEIQLALWPDSPASRARSSFDSLLSRVRRTLDQVLEPFDSKKYLVVKRGYLFLENARIDAHEFRRLVRKGSQQVAAGDLWPAEISFSSAFSLWQGTFVPGCFGLDCGAAFQNEMEQTYLESSLTFARLLAESKRYQQATKLLRSALRYDATNDSVTRLLYQLFLAEDNLGQASQVLKHYIEALAREGFSEDEVQESIQDFSKDHPPQSWLAGR
jgi:DNA-binding response OmpR family regulator